MLSSVVLLAALVVGAAPSDPPPPLESEPPPMYEMDPGPTTPPPLDAPAPDPLVRPPGMDPFLTGALQVGAGCAVMMIASAVPLVGTALAPLGVGLVQTVIGDMLGQQRGTFLWTTVGAYVGAWCIGLPGLVLGIFGGIALSVGGITAFFATIGANANPLAILPLLFGAYAAVGVGILVGLVAYYLASTITPAVFYAFTAEDKLPGDTGQGLPGFREPHHPTRGPAKQIVRRRLVSAMAY